MIAEEDGRIVLTYNYRRVNRQSVMHVMPLISIDDPLFNLGGAHIFTTMDQVSVFFQCSIHQAYIPLTAVCT